MGRATRWFKRLFGTKKSIVSDLEKEQNTQAIAVATITATTAEAKAAESVVRLTSERRAGDVIMRDERWAVVKIQKVFRGSLARKALRALKGIVKLQALVRGYLVRKRAAVMLHNMQTLLRVQTVMRSKRSRRLNKEYNHMFQPQHALAEVAIDDAVKRRSKSRPKHNVGSMSEHEDGFVYQRNDLELNLPKEKWKFARTPRLSSSLHSHSANNRYYVMQSPGKSVCGEALCEYGMSSTPGYMEKTQSFKAKVRSHSAPHQRSERKRLSLDEVVASRSSVSGESLVLQHQEPRYSCS